MGMTLRIIHWANDLVSPSISGLKTTVRELVEAELEMGIDSGICDPLFPEGGAEVQLRRRKVALHPWTWALEKGDGVSFFSSLMPTCFYELPHRVQVNHAMPEFVMWHQLHPQIANSMTIALNYALLCEATICWSRREAQFWRNIDHARVECVERGCDLRFWNPSGDRFDFIFHPQVGFLEVMRGSVKSPLTFLFAVKEAQRRVRTLRAQFGNIDPSQDAATWMMLITKLNLDLVVEDFIVGVHPEPWKFYRALDLLVCPVHGGHISRVGVEALACGCPVILLEGSDEKAASAKCRDSPDEMAAAILGLWDRIKEDPQAVRAEARKIAESNYDIRITARKFIQVAEELI